MKTDLNVKQVQINNDITYQSIEGFGSSFAWYINWMADNPNDREIYDLMFIDAKATILRLKNSYRYYPNFAPKAELELYQEAKKRAEAYGEKVIVLMSSWSQASYLKENGKIKGGSSIKKDANGHFMYEEYGRYWLELVKEYEAYGIPIDIISIQNECDFTADYDGCEFGTEETEELASYSKAYLAVYQALQTLENPPKMMGPETMTVDAGRIGAFMKEVFEKAPESVYGIAHHLYAGGTHEDPNSFLLNMQRLREDYKHLPKWQTEFYRGDCLQMAWIIHNSLTVENLNAYLYWDGIWALPGGLIGFEDPSKKAAWTNEKGYKVNDKYYVLRHFSEFIRPGYKRIDTASLKDADLLVSAYTSDNQNKMALVAVNKSEEDKKVSLGFSAYQIEDSCIYTSCFRDGYTREELYVKSGSLGENKEFVIPARGLVTIDISGKADSGIVIRDESRKSFGNIITDTGKYLKASKKEITIDGRNEEVWMAERASRISNVANGDHGASAEFKALWSDKYLYIRAEVKDDTPDTSAADYFNQDSVEVFLNEDHSKPEVYKKGDQHYIITRDNEVIAGQGAELNLFKSHVSSDQNGYIVELAIPFTSIIPKADKLLGFEIQVNDSHGQGLRNYALKWSDTSLDSDQSLKLAGTIILK